MNRNIEYRIIETRELIAIIQRNIEVLTLQLDDKTAEPLKLSDVCKQISNHNTQLSNLYIQLSEQIASLNASNRSTPNSIRSSSLLSPTLFIQKLQSPINLVSPTPIETKITIFDNNSLSRLFDRTLENIEVINIHLTDNIEQCTIEHHSKSHFIYDTKQKKLYLISEKSPLYVQEMTLNEEKITQYIEARKRTQNSNVNNNTTNAFLKKQFDTKFNNQSINVYQSELHKFIEKNLEDRTSAPNSDTEYGSDDELIFPIDPPSSPYKNK